MPIASKHITDHWENELLGIAQEAIECAIASAYLDKSGVDLLSKVAKRLTEFVRVVSKTLIRVVLSRQFAPDKDERLEILRRLEALPGVEVRVYRGSEFQHRKNYIFRTKDEIRVVVGSINLTSAGLFKNLEIATLTVHESNDPEAVKVISEFQSLWEGSDPAKKYVEMVTTSENQPHFSEGENVRYISTNKVCTINKVIKGTRGYSYKLTIDGKTRVVAERFLEPYVDVEETVIEDFRSGKFGTHLDYKLFQTWFRLAKPLESNLYSYLGSKTIFNPHQFKPLLRFLSPGSDERLFIADEVGVGKTIETGIILTELIARGRLDQRTPVLVVCPNSLGSKWYREMKDRFRLNFHLHDGKSLKYTLESVLRGDPFPQSYVYAVVGLQLLRREEYRKILEEVDAKREASVFGMVIIDESHHMRNPETDSNELGNLLSNMSDMMLMLSATPLNLRSEDLYNQMHILNSAAFPDLTTFETLQSPVIRLNRIRNLIAGNTPETRAEILDQLDELRTDPLGKVICEYPEIERLAERLKDSVPFSSGEVIRYERMFVSLSPMYHSFTRTRKREALEHQVQREAWELPIDLSDEERQFQDDVINTLKNHYLSKGVDPRGIGFIINTHRRMVSSCIPVMKKYLEWCVKENRIIVDESQAPEEVEDDSQLTRVELDPALKREFERLLEQARKLENVDSKYNQFELMIKKILSNPETPQAMVFSFFIRTLEYLKRRLEADGFIVGLIHGEVPQQGTKDTLGRDQIMDGFKSGKYEILLSSEVGGEGLDFQYCHAIINYDLPYNPMRVEQRIGRIDRFGQKADKVIIANLYIKKTVDEEIYDRLYRRIRLVEDGIGTLEPILGKELSNIQAAIITGTLTQEQKEETTRRLEEAIASAKAEMEDFEKHRTELLSDDYLAKPINNITQGNFVSPEDAIQLTEQCLSKWDGCEFARTKNGSFGEVVLSEKTISKIERFLRRPGNESGYGELQPLLTAKRRIKVLFDGSVAEDSPGHVFLSPTGYWTRFLTYELEQEKSIFKTFSFAARSSEVNLPLDEYIVFLFEVRMEGVRKEIDFLAVPVRISIGSVVGTDLGSLPRILSSASSIDAHPSEDLDPVPFLEVAREYLEQILEEKRRVASEENRFKVESRIAALNRSSQIRVKKLQQQMDSHITKRAEEGKEPEERYLRLTKARSEKEKARLENMITELQKHQELSLDYNLEAIVLLEVYDE